MKASDFYGAMPKPTKWLFRMGCLRTVRIQERRTAATATFKFRYWHPVVILLLSVMLIETVLRSIHEMLIDIWADMHDATDEVIRITIRNEE